MAAHVQYFEIRKTTFVQIQTKKSAKMPIKALVSVEPLAPYITLHNC